MELFDEGVVSLVNKTVVAVIGCGCSSATEEVAKVNNGSLPLVSLRLVKNPVFLISYILLASQKPSDASFWILNLPNADLIC